MYIEGGGESNHNFKFNITEQMNLIGHLSFHLIGQTIQGIKC